MTSSNQESGESIGRLWSNIERADTSVGTLQHGLYRSSGLFEFALLPR